MSLTEEVMQAVLAAPDDRKREALKVLRGPVVKAPPRIIRFTAAAEQLGCAVKSLHRLARQGGIRKCRLPGRVKCHGILEEDLVRLMADGVRVVTRDSASVAH